MKYPNVRITIDPESNKEILRVKKSPHSEVKTFNPYDLFPDWEQMRLFTPARLRQEVWEKVAKSFRRKVEE